MFRIITEKLTIDKKDLINGFLKNNKSENSELTFTNLFMWRKSYNVEYALIEKMLVIFSKHESSSQVVYFPIGDGDFKEALDEVVKHFGEKNEEFLIRISDEKDIEKLNKAYPDTFVITEDTDNNDYVYLAEDLNLLKGKKYHAKRNFINRFKNKYSYSYENMTPDMKDECLELFEKWYNEKKDEVAGIDEHLEAVKEIFENWDRLDIKGGCIRADGKMIAFSFGEELIPDKEMAVIHLEHADTSFEGAYPMMNNAFVQNVWSDYKYINREEDMGLEGLRKAKQSYYPVKMARKYYAKLK